MALQIRRGTEAQRAVLTGVAGELLYTTDTKKLYVGDGVTAGGTEAGITEIPNLDASKITTGELANARVADLPASKITTGELANARVADLPASKITSGTIASARIDNTSLNAITALPAGVGGKVLQVVNATMSSQVSWSTVDVETFIYQASITPTKATTKILAIACIGGLNNGGGGRLSGRIRWDTSSGGTSGTIIAGATQVAQAGVGTAHIGTMSMTALSDAVGTTSALYFKVTMQKHDSGGTMYACQYNSQSQISLMEIEA